MSEARWAFIALVSHWRRHPMNFATLIAGLAIATALWSGVQALNSQARTSYGKAAAVFSEAGAPSFVAAKGVGFRQEVYVALRRAGWAVSPVLEGVVRVGGNSLRLVGIEPLTGGRGSAADAIGAAGDLEAFLRAPGQTLMSPETARGLRAAAGARPRTEAGGELPPVVLSDAITPGMLVVDISVAQRLLGRGGQISRIVFAPSEKRRADDLPPGLQAQLRLEAGEDGGDLARMTDSFHLNLTAFGFLAFVVGLFIVHASIGLAFEQRLAAVRTMRAVGVSLWTVIGVMIAEVVVLALLAGLMGMALGYAVASALLPDVAASLSGLYGAHVEGHLTLAPVWWISGLGMALAGALAAAAASLFKIARLPVLVIGRPVAWREAQLMQLRRQAFAGVACLAVAAVAYTIGAGLETGFVIMAGLLLGAALLLPVLLAAVLRLGEQRSGNVLARWFWADTRQQLSGLSLALMALLLALAANVGVGTMVEGFRKTFTGWLDERLNSEVYFDAVGRGEAREIEAWLRARPDVDAVLPVWKAETRMNGWPVDVYGTRDHATYRDHFSLIAEVPGAWDLVRDGTAALISEQLARRLGLGLGDDISVPAAAADWTVKVAGIYPDYGNPKGQIRINVDALVAHWPEARRTSYSLRVPDGKAHALMSDMQSAFGDKLTRVVDQAELKAVSKRIFERTFAVTGALNTLTLIVSGVALFSSLLALSDARIAQVAPVWALGVARRRLGDFEIGKLLVLAAVTALFAIPLGLLLAWCLVAIVNVYAFGWRLPFHVFPGQWAFVFGLAVLTAFLAAIVPVVRLARTQPQDLLKVFANER